MIQVNYLRSYLIIVLFLAVQAAFGQDARVSQYHAVPLLVNPAQTGDFDGQLRVLGLAARVNSRFAHNYFYNGSIDYNLGQSKWAVGLNYMRSGASAFPVSGQYFGASVSRSFLLDQAQLQQFRVGAQLSYLQGKVDANEKGYNRLLDVSAFRHLNRPLENAANGNTASSAYVNYSLGVKYKFELERFRIETGFSAYNVTNPDYNFAYEGYNTLLKRYRVTALTSLYYQFSRQNAFKIEHYSWKEGIFLRDYKPSRDTVGIHETTYSFTWLRRVRKNTLSLGLYTRSWQSVYGVVGVNISDRIGLSASYESPILKPYYDVAHVELGLSFYPFRKRSAPKNLPEKLSRQVGGLLPFGTEFCLPCEVKLVPVRPQRIVPPANELADTIAPAAGKVSPLLPLRPNTGDGLLYRDTIYYNLDKYNIRPDAQVKLDQIGRLMKKLDLSLDVRSHTDLRANAAYNERLSENRANAVKAYLTGSGVPTDKISASWYGKKQPVNDCLTCIDSVQERNRRSELTLKGFNDENLQIMLANKVLGAEVKTKAELQAKIRNILSLENNTAHVLSGAVTDRGTDGVYYTIQVGAFKALKAAAALDLKWLNMFNEMGKDGYRRYFYGVFLNREEAGRMLVKLQQLGLKDSFIRPLNLSLNL